MVNNRSLRYTRYMKTAHVRYTRPLSVPIVHDHPGSPSYVLTLRDLPNHQKPREKLNEHGPGILTTPELLALMLVAGTRKEDIMTMCNRIMREYGEKSIVAERSPKRMAKSLNIPLIKATQIIAAMEMGRRLFERGNAGRATIRTADDVYRYARAMQELPREHLRGIYLDSSYKIIRDETLSIGTVDAHIIHPRDVFRPAIEYGAVAVVLVHNHPSGNLTPSADDREITRQLVAVGTLLGIPLVDHVIVSSNGFRSIMHPAKSL